MFSAIAIGGIATLFFLISTQSTDASVIRDGGDVNAAGLLVSFTTVKRKEENPIL